MSCRVVGWPWVRGARRWALKTDHWFYGLFQSAPDLIALLLPASVLQAPLQCPRLGLILLAMRSTATASLREGFANAALRL